MERLVCLDDFQREAVRKLGKSENEFYSSGADDEITLKDNQDSYARILIRPRMLRDVSKRDLSTVVLGKKVQVPFGIAPTGFQRLAHPEGECGSVKAVGSVGGIMVLSMFATTSYEEVAAAAPNARKWLQLYMPKDRSLAEGIIRRAEQTGFEAVVLTVDAPYIGNRRANKRDPFRLPTHVQLPNATGDAHTLGMSNFFKIQDSLDHGITWETVIWLKRVTKLPLVIKGILRPDDALRAVEHGAAAVWISNHGGRQIDTVPAAIDVLPSIVRAVGNQAEIYLDGGIRTGTDIFKSLALGATMAFIGRPAIWGLAVDGTKGVTKVLEILRNELDLTMALTGAANIQAITPDYVCSKACISKL